MRTHTTSAEDVDLDTLRDLNHAYIQSVLNGDVDCFRRILSEDFLCSNPDGALLDKQQFLERTAGARTLERLEEDEVRIRVLGDVAIIHAATRYTTLDGQDGRGRYTDVWQKRGGTWLAVSAHVTRL